MAIINNHPIRKIEVDNTNSYLFNYLDTQKLDLEVHNDWSGLKNLLTSKDDYPYSFDPCFDPTSFQESTNGFSLYLKDGDRVVATYAAREQHPNYIKEGLSNYYNNTKIENLPTSLTPTNLRYYYSSCQWVDTEYLGRRIGVTLDLIKKHIIFDWVKADCNYAIHKVNDTMISYHKSKLFYVERNPIYKHFVTVIKHLCKINNIPYDSKILYYKSSYELTYKIYYNFKLK